MKNLLPVILLFFSGYSTSAQLSLQFVPNEGQWAHPFLYKGIAANADIYLENEGITYMVGDEHNWEKVDEYKEGHLKEPPA